MGCGCGGSIRAGEGSGSQQASPTLRGPAAPGYYWEGPEKPPVEKQPKK